MSRPVASFIRALGCRRGSTLVGYSSLALLTAIAAIMVLGRADPEGGGAPHQRAVGVVSPD